MNNFKMGDFSKSAISEMIRDCAKRTEIWDQQGQESQLTKSWKISKFCEKNSKWAT